MNSRCHLCGCNTFSNASADDVVDKAEITLNHHLQSVELIPPSPATVTSVISAINLSWHSILTLTSDGNLYISGFFNGKNHQRKLLETEVRCFGRLWDSIIFATEDGKLFVKHSDGSNEQINISVDDKIVQITCTDNCGFVCSEKGQVKKCSYEDNRWLSEDINLDFNVSQIACGKEHVLFLSDNGQVYSCGSGSRAQLGHGNLDVTPQNRPRLVEELDGVRMKQVSAGGWHSATLSEIGDVYIWGWNESGQLGFSNDPSNEDAVNFLTHPTLLEVDGEESMKKIVCGSKHTAVLTEKGDVFTWGWNKYGQLGRAGTTSDCNYPGAVKWTDKSERIVDIYAGAWNTTVITKTI